MHVDIYVLIMYDVYIYVSVNILLKHRILCIKAYNIYIFVVAEFICVLYVMIYVIINLIMCKMIATIS